MDISPAFAPLRPLGARNVRTYRPETVVAILIAFGAALRTRLPLDVPLGVALAFLVLPVSVSVLTRYRGALSISLLGLLAALSGGLLTYANVGSAPTDMRMLASNVAQLLGLVILVAALLWSRSIVGSRVVVLAFGFGMLVSLPERGINWDNPWKFSFSVPLTLILLSLPWVYQKRWPQTVIVGVLCALSMASDSRSLTGMLLIALLLTLTQGSERRVAGGSRVVLVGIRIAVVGVAGFLLVQAAILEGLLGEGAQERTEMQIATSGSSLAGGRPEMGAAVSLINARPGGFGSGILPTGADILTAKTGMLALGYDPNNGYVNNYMFGNGFEVHSVLGDLWLLHGLAGLLLAVALIAFAIWGLSRALSTGLASTVMVFLVLRLVWDMAFSPFDSALLTLPLALAVALPPRPPRARRSLSGGIEARVPRP